jgi:phosphinothricin acetyltransferase
MEAGMIIRPATQADAEALAGIYGHAVLHGFGTFETTPPTAEEMDRRRRVIAEHDLPYVVAEVDGRVVGYAYASVFRPRPGYRFTVEDSVYVAPEAAGAGVGRAVLSRVLEDCEAMGLRQIVAVIGDSGNSASIALHRRLGFSDAGVVRNAGHKHGRWVDIVLMQKALNGGATRDPDTPGLALGGG